MHEIYLRVLFAFFSGYFLSLSGSLCQLSTHNSLSSPSTLGFTGVGVFSILIAFFIQQVFSFSMELEQIGVIVFLVGLGLFSLFVKLKAKKFERVQNFILLGIGFNLFIGAIFSIIQFILVSKGIRFPSSIWFGSFRVAESSSVFIYGALFSISLLFVKNYSSSLQVMNLGELFSKSMGIQVQKVRFLSLSLSLILSSIVVIYFGVFAFVGLVMPHILRFIPFFKYSIKRELQLGPFVAGLIIMSLDLVCYWGTVYGAEMPVGMLSAVGGSLALITILFLSEKVSS